MIFFLLEAILKIGAARSLIAASIKFSFCSVTQVTWSFDSPPGWNASLRSGPVWYWYTTNSLWEVVVHIKSNQQHNDCTRHRELFITNKVSINFALQCS